MVRTPDELTGVGPGKLVEVSGTVISDPVLRALGAVSELATLIKDGLEIRPLGSVLERYLGSQQPAFAAWMGWEVPEHQRPKR